ncbi:MAG: hypothetical protein GF333_04190 [Candidatus Omnitrophica bacterium]|nr:hypothetical protein [Candidatus Omnitrophota bacterium]
MRKSASARQVNTVKNISKIIFFIFYDLLFILLFLLYLPVYLKRGKITAAALKEKLGLLPLRLEESIWIQVVSVGEVNLVGTLIHRLREKYSLPIVVSTTTLTGNMLAKKKFESTAHVIFFPFDLFFVLRTVIRRLNPKIFIAVETEIWPHVFSVLHERGIPSVIVNGRISRKAFQQYRIIKPCISRVLRTCSAVGVQNELYRQRFLQIGCPPEKTAVSGNMKFESIGVNEARRKDFLSRYTPCLKPHGEFLLVAGSTHAPEEELLVRIYQDIIKSEAGVGLCVAPRHIERVPELEKKIAALGFPTVRMSRITEPPEERCVFLLDTIGQLRYLYSLADACFVGGSMGAHGGQNILEPLYFSKPTCFGYSMENFQDVKERVLEKGAGIQVANTEELRKVLLQFVRDTALRENLRAKCRVVFEEEKKSLTHNMEIIQRHLDPVIGKNEI